MKIAEFVTSEWPYPVPDGVVYAPLDVVIPLANGFVKAGHHVDWYGPKGTTTLANLKDYSFSPLALSPDWDSKTPDYRTRMSLFHDGVYLSHIAQNAEDYDIIHFHSTRICLPFARLIKKPVLITLHSSISSTVSPNARAYVEPHLDLKNVQYIGISKKQQSFIPEIPYAATIYHGIDLKNYTWSPTGGDRWIFVGRIIPEKGVDIAIRLAKRLGQGLDIIGPYYPDEPHQKSFFEEKIKPAIDGEQIKYLGAMKREDLLPLYAKAKGFIFPVLWEEAFGLTVIESLASGTPVVAFHHGSMPEIIQNGKTGFVVENEEAMFEAMKKIDQIDRKACRADAEERFSVEAMVNNYLRVFEQTAGKPSGEVPNKKPWYKFN